MNVYQYSGYREILREALLARKASHGRAYTFAKMAHACRLQHTYLSTVLKGSGHLNGDQVFQAAEFLGLADAEYRYLSALHEHERSVSPPRRQRLEREIEELRQQGLRTEAYVTAPSLAQASTSALSEFYLDIHAQLVHMFLTVKRFRADVPAIRKTLGLDEDVMQAAMEKVERAGLVVRDGKRIEVLREDFHLPASSPFYPVYRQTMRLKALELMQSRSKASQQTFSVLYSATEDSRRKIHSRFREFIEWAQVLTQASEATDVYQMNFDLLRWSRD